jgi:hypothetical protein
MMAYIKIKRKKNYLCFNLMHFSLFKSIVEINRALPFWKILAYVFLLVILGTSHCSGFVRLINTVLLLDAPSLPTRWVNISTYLRLEQSLSITFAHQPKLLIIDFSTILIFYIIQFLFFTSLFVGLFVFVTTCLYAMLRLCL